MALSYPLEIEENPDFYRSMIEFKVFDTEPAQLTTLESKESFKAGEQSRGFSLSDLGALLDRASQGKLDLPKGSDGPPLAREVITPAPGFETIKLYMPVSFTMTDTLSYANAELGATGALGLAAARGGANIAGAANAALEEGMAGITDTLDAILGSGQLGPLGTARLAQKVGGNLGSALEQAGQVVMNPNIRASFKSVGLRRFNFLFNLIPKNGRESRAITNIIHTFRRAAYPEDITTGPVSLAFKYPQLFRVIPKVKTNAGYVAISNDIQYCYLESISVNTNPIGNNTYHEDGQPVQTDLSLNFLEYRTISRRDVEKSQESPKGDADGPLGKGVGDPTSGIEVTFPELQNTNSKISDLQRRVNAIGVGDL